MKFEYPISRRCCFCFPGRYGLLFFACVRLASFTFLTYISCYQMTWLFSPWLEVPDDVYPLEVTNILLYTLFNFFNMLLGLVLLLAALKKSLSISKLFQRCELIGVCLNAVLAVAMLVIDMYIMWYYGMEIFHYARLRVFLIELLPELLYIFVQLYTLSLVKNQINKLSENKGFRFTSLSNECVYDDDEKACNYDCDTQFSL